HSKELIGAVNARLKRANLMKSKVLDENEENVNRYKQDDNIILSISNNTNIIKVNRIIYIIAERQYSKVVITDGKNVLLRKSLLYWESILPSNIFIRIHRNTIVNVHEVNSISKKSDNKYKAIMKTSRIEFEISRRYMKKIRDVFLV
ncbi:LytTR family transcriptional regulator DNA-binding domain-containing protein, partial [Dolichospermum sp. ST_sed3]|nr:LytTR family transcriptional regulator DNA-binding domain-containing protein [Dolichospermum sp. ST_sed3]